MNQARLEKYASATNLPRYSLQGQQNCVKANSEYSEASNSSNQKDLKRKKWTWEEYKEIMEAYYYAKYHPSNESNIKQTYTLWMKKNLNNRQYIDTNKLANVRRQILKEKKITDTKNSQIEEAAKDMTPEKNVEPVLIIENLDNEEIEQMVNKIGKEEKIIQQEEQTDKIEQENYELEPET